MTAVAMRDALGEFLVEQGERRPEVVVLDADVASSTRTAAFGKRFPDRFFNVGVAESNMVDVAAGLATCGLRPVVSTFALFLTLKGGEQIRNIIAYNNLPVVLLGGYAGLSDSFDGASHQAILDLAVMRAMPNLEVLVPSDSAELGHALNAALDRDGPTYIRICRNPTPVLFDKHPAWPHGRLRHLRQGSDLTIIACGITVAMAIEATDQLAGEGIGADLFACPSLKPFDVGSLAASAARTGRVLTVEEHTVIGGLAGAVSEALARSHPARMASIGIADRFTESGPYDALLAKHGLSAENIAARARAIAREDWP
ncbi:MAG: transketolase family protein [Bryobacter sp.]|nr:transketolase family protein [Bryobacter sp.]